MKRALVLLLGLTWAVAARAESGRVRSYAIYPAQRLPLVFSHQVHLDADLECVACHDKARKSLSASDLLLPTGKGGAKPDHPDCDSCHDIANARAHPNVSPPATCGTCHLNEDGRPFDETAREEPARLVFPSANIVFPHKVHVDKKIQCQVCHGTMRDTGTLATRQQLPKMETCLNCHDGTYASSDCRTCHLTEPSGRLQLSFVSGILRPMQGNPLGIDHGPGYEFTHGTRAKLDRQSCMQCHQQRECDECHNGMQKPLSIHPNDYLTLHPVEARMDTPKCDSCHRYQSFCASCHERMGVGLAADPYFRPRNARVHPSYQVWVQTIGPQHHAFAASRNIQECISCHREEDCMVCHSDANKLGTRNVVDPHPTGFANLCKALMAKNPRPCLTCHTSDSPALTTLCK